MGKENVIFKDGWFVKSGRVLVEGAQEVLADFFGKPAVSFEEFLCSLLV